MILRLNINKGQTGLETPDWAGLPFWQGKAAGVKAI